MNTPFFAHKKIALGAFASAAIISLAAWILHLSTEQQDQKLVSQENQQSVSAKKNFKNAHIPARIQGNDSLSSNLSEEEPSSVLSDDIAKVLNPDICHSVKSQILYSMRNKSLERQDELALINYYESPLHTQQWALKNDVLELLVRKGTNLPGITRAIKKTLQDSDAESVIREYTLQYLPEYIGRIEEDEQESIQQLVVQLLDEPTPTIPGAALLTLYRIGNGADSVTKKKIAQHAVLILKNGPGIADRVAAAQILGALQEGKEELEEASLHSDNLILSKTIQHSLLLISKKSNQWT